MRIVTLFLLLWLSLFGGLCIDAAQADKLPAADSSANFHRIQEKIRDLDLLSTYSERELKQYHRWLWFWRYRVGETGDMSRAAKEARKFLEQRLKEQKSRRTGLPIASVQQQPPSWTPLGPTLPLGGSTSAKGIGRAETIWVDPSNHNFILIGAATGGIWKTVDGGSNWLPLTDDIISIGISDIEVNPTNHDVIYFSSGVQTNGLLRGKYGLGVLKSTDGGDTWAITNMGIEYQDQQMILELLMHPNNPDILYALSEKKIYKTVNGGTNWIVLVDISDVENVVFKDFKFKPGDPNTVYVCGANSLWPPAGEYANGAIWTLVHDGIYFEWTQIGQNVTLPANSEVSYIGLGVREDEPDTIYSGYVFYNTSSEAFYKSTDEGATWVQVNGSGAAFLMNYILDIDRSANGKFYVSSYYMYRSLDELATLSSIQANVHPDIRRLRVFAWKAGIDKLFAATDGGIYRSDNSGDSWTNISGNLQINQFYTVSIYEPDSDLLLAGTHDCGTMRRNAGGWSAIFGGDGGSTLIDHSNPDIMYLTCNRMLLKSTNGGSSSSWLYDGGGYYTMSCLDSPIVQHPTDPDTIIADGGGKKLKRSSNGGATWTVISNEALGSGSIIAAMDICASDPDYIYYATTTWYYDEGSLIKTANGGTSWDVVPLPPGLPLYITGIASLEVNPEDPDEIWIGLGFFEANHKVYHSVDGGTNWTNESDGLANFPVNRLLYDPDNYCLYAATDVGVYYKASDMSTWARLGNNLPYVLVADMKINRQAQKLVAASHGRGMWQTAPYQHPYASFPYATGFEDGRLDQYWYTNRSTANGRIRVTDEYQPYQGTYHVTMDVDSPNTYNRNELMLRIDLKDKTNVKLKFKWKDFEDETHADDGVYLSDDGGANFVKVYSFNPSSVPDETWQSVFLNLYTLAQQHNLTLNQNFVIKFQQYDDYPISTDGIAIDDVALCACDEEPQEEEE